jgi:hypothetical protein
MYPLSKIYQKTVEVLRYYRDEILGILGRLVPGIIGILILKYMPALSFIQQHLNFDRIFVLLIALFLEGFAFILLGLSR